MNRRQHPEDRLWTATVVGVLVLLLAIGGIDRAIDGLDAPRTTYGTVVADDPDSAATNTDVPGGDR